MTTRTPPEIKWLLVERATLLGDIAQLERRRASIDVELDALRQRADALAVSLRILEPLVRPDAAGVVSRHHPAYGKRGALKEFVLDVIRECDTGLSSREIGLVAAAHFGIEFGLKSELCSYLDNSVRPALKDLRRAGTVESIPQAGGGPDMLWRWKRQLPTFAELALLAGAPQVPTVAPGASDGHPDPA